MITKVFGIRHHGPGSAKSLMKALNEMQPDCILIESPEDAESALQYVQDKDLKPPVAILTYNPKDLNQAIYLPFAAFSPEWKAMQFGASRHVPVRFMDLPMSMTFTLGAERLVQQKISFGDWEDKVNIPTKLQRDPLGYMASLAGYEDSERWWEAYFEHPDHETDVFESIAQLMTQLRQESGKIETDRTLQREAFMRKCIRKAVKEGFKNIAIVCGAWHVPALQDWMVIKQARDNAILKGIKKIKTTSTWIPWSYDRLARQSGYGAGVVSPSWYDMLASNRKEVVIRWMVKVARLFRKEDMDASAAHVIEAVRLANNLADLRGLALPGIEEMKEAAVSVLCGGDDSQMAIINEKLIIGDVMGKVPDHIPQVPLQKDLEKRIKSARLTKERNTTEVIHKDLDLRTPSNMAASLLLHRMNVLNINWGAAKKDRDGALGNFQERWKLKWKPEFIIKAIEAGMWGNTVEEAATNFIQKRAVEEQNLAELTVLIEQALNGQLNQAIDFLVHKLTQVSAITQDVLLLMDALVPMVRIIRYGNLRNTDTESVELLVEQIVPRICIGLPAACTSIEDEVAQDVLVKIQQMQSDLSLLNNEHYNQNWHHNLAALVRSKAAHPLLKGLAVRLLFDKKIFDLNLTTTEMYYALSKGQEPTISALWLEGFLNGSGLLLIHTPALFKILDEWVDRIVMSDFNGILPLLRRTFSTFSSAERRKMLEFSRFGDTILLQGNRGLEIDKARGEKVLPLVKLLLG